MPKIPVTYLSRPKPIATTSPIFTDPDQPGHELQMTVRELDPIEEDAVVHLAQERQRKYVTGGWKDESGAINVAPLPPIPVMGSDKGINLNFKSIYELTLLEMMQQPEPPDEPYEFEELAVLAVTMPEAYRKLQDWIEGDDRKAAIKTKKNPDSTAPLPE